MGGYFSTTPDTLIKFSDLENLKESTIKGMEKELIRTGWCLIDFDEETKDDFATFAKKVSEFFKTGLDEKNKYRYSSNFGYVPRSFKESFRWLTGSLIQESEVPEQFSNRIKKLSNRLDSFFANFIKKMSQTYFQVDDQTLGQTEKITLLIPQEQGKVGGYGMFDVVEYTTEDIDREKMVVEHMDPGLFSLSLFSNAEGLELYDHDTKLWVPISLDKGVVWTGLTAVEASKNLFKGGYHRVQQHKAYPRLTMWYEVSIRNQLIKEEILHGMKRYTGTDNSFLNPISDWNNDELFPIEIRTLPLVMGTEKSEIIYVHKNMKISEVKAMVENISGLQTGKERFKSLKNLANLRPLKIKEGKRFLKNEYTIGEYAINPNEIIILY